MIRELLREKRAVLLQMGLLLLLVVLFFHRAAFSFDLLFYYDTIMQNFPFGLHFAEGFADFTLRLWCPGMFSGFPLFAEGQAGPLYPLFAPLLLLAPFWVVFKFSVLLHSFLAGVFMLLFLRQMKLKPQSYLFGAVVFAFSGFFVAQVTHLNIIRGYCYLPGVLYACQYVRDRDLRRWWLIPALVGAFLLGTHPYIAIYLFLAVGLWLIFSLLRKPARKGQRRRLIAVVLGLMLGIGVAACQLLPSAELLSHSTREDTGVDFFTAGSLPVRNLITFLLPSFFGTPGNSSYWGLGEIGLYAEFCGYVGLLTLLLAAIAVVFVRDRRLMYFWVLLIGALLLALGRHTPLHQLVAGIPIMSATRTPARFLYLVTFALAGLSAFGIEHLLSVISDKRRARSAAIFIMIMVALPITLGLAFALPNLKAISLYNSQSPVLKTIIGERSASTFSHYGDALRKDLLQFSVIIVASAVLLLMMLHSSTPRRAGYIGYALIALIFVDLFWFGSDFNPVASTKIFSKPPKAVRFLRMDGDIFRTIRWHVNEIWFPDEHPGKDARRADPFTPGWEDNLEKYKDCTDSLVPNTNLLYGVDSADGYTSFLLSRYNEALGAPGKCAMPRSKPTAGLMSLLNVKYGISTQLIESDQLCPVFADKDLYIYRYRDFLPRFFLVDKTRVLPTDEEVLRDVTSPDFHPLAGLVLDRPQLQQASGWDLESLSFMWAIPGTEGPSDLRKAESGGPPGEVAVLEYSANEAVVRTNANRPCWLIFSDNYYPGWSASVNGSPVPVMRAYGLVKAAPVPRGTSEVRFSFEPESFRLGLFISLLSLLIGCCAALCTRHVRQSEQMPPLSASEDVRGLALRWLILLVAAGLVLVPIAFTKGNADAFASNGLRFEKVIARAYVNSASKAIERGENELARDATLFALEVSPEGFRAHYLLGVSLFKLGDRNGARAAWQKCLQLKPDYSPAIRSLGVLGRGYR
ncbi:YfhO family protein [bacterium]|nr:YfhO family protein [bacterium]